ncbi:MAG TPA: class II aldolase/adducin family protein, partial [Acetobacteraceae bacterium]
MEDLEARRAIVEACREMNSLGLNQGTSGNISLRRGETMLITPSAMPYDRMGPGDIAAVALNDPDGAWNGPRRPSTEWRLHRDILRSRSE